MLKVCKDCKVIFEESVILQHRIMVIDIKWEKCKSEKWSRGGMNKLKFL